jgi:hypothetical protein
MTDRASATPVNETAASKYALGSVWVLTFIKVKPGMCDAYLNQLVPVRKRLMAEAMQTGLVLSHKILNGFSSNASDWDLMVMVEYKNWAALDGLKDKLEAINQKVLGSEATALTLMEERSVSRQFVGDKPMQEIVFL